MSKTTCALAAVLIGMNMAAVSHAADDSTEGAKPANQPTARSSAESSVTIYGRLSAAVWNRDSGESAGAGPGMPGITGGNSGLLSDSGHLGFRGREGLGGGNYVRFHLEQRFSLDTGASTAGPYWFGTSVVGLGGPWGEVTLGREYTPYQRVGIRADPTVWTGITQLALAYTAAKYNTNFGLTGPDNSARRNNSVTYTSPSFSGVRVSAAIAAGENATPKSAHGASVVYESGPLFVGLAYDEQPGTDSRLVNGSAVYNFGPVRLHASYADAKGGVSGNAKSKSLSLAVPVGANMVWLNTGRLDVEAADKDQWLVGGGYRYYFSKTASVYVSAARAKLEGKEATTITSLGLTKFF